MPNILSAKQLSAYKKDGYVHLRGIIPETLLDLGRGVLNRWTDGIIQGWVDSGLVSHSGSELNFNERLVSVWNAAGKPRYSRSPRSELVSNEMYRLLTDRALLDIAEDLLGTSEISLHGIFNGRGKLPDQRWTDTPWHQDAQ